MKLPQKEDGNVMVIRDGMALDSDLYADLDDPNPALYVTQPPQDVGGAGMRRRSIPDFQSYNIHAN